MNAKTLFGDKSFWQSTLRLALPIAIQNVLSGSFVLIDTMMVSRLGALTLSAVGMAGQWGWLLNIIIMGLSAGMSVFVSQYWGVKDRLGIRRAFGMAMVTGTALWGLFLGVALGRPEFVLGLFNKDPQVVAAGCRYLTVICWSYPAIAISMIMGMVLRGTEHVKLPVYVSVITTILNIILDYGMIFGHLGFPAMGVEGAALASVLSAWLGPVLLLLLSLRERNLLMGPVGEIFHFGLRDLGTFYRKALPVVGNEALWASGVVALNMIYSNLGYEYYAGLTVFKTFNEMTFAFYCGLCNACIIMVGKTVGQGKIHRAVQDAARFTLLVPLVGIVLGALTIVFREPLLGIFSRGDNLSALTLRTAMAILMFNAVESGFRNISYVQVVGVFRSGGDTLYGMLLDLFCLWCVAIPLAWAGAHWLQLPFVAVVILAYLGEDIPKAVLCLWHFKSRRWLRPVTEEGREGLRQYEEERRKL